MSVEKTPFLNLNTKLTKKKDLILKIMISYPRFPRQAFIFAVLIYLFSFFSSLGLGLSFVLERVTIIY